MSTVAVLIHQSSLQAGQHGELLRRRLESRGHKIVDMSEAVRSWDCEKAPVTPAHLLPALKDLQNAELLVCLGGDGSMLRAVALAAAVRVPVIGINFGYKGYLTETEPESMFDHIETALAGQAVIEERMRVCVEVERVDGRRSVIGAALNEALIERSDSGRTIRLGLNIDGEDFITYNADGIMVASPTGSTAYSLSARGPIVAPTHRAMIINAVSPHQLFDRALIVGDESQIEIEVLANRDASLCIDGRTMCKLEPGDRVICTASDWPALIVKGSRLHFLSVLKNKFGLAS